PETPPCKRQKTLSGVRVISLSSSSFEKLRNHQEFREVYGKGRKLSGPLCTVHFLQNNLHIMRYGLTVTRYIGKAVKRNRIRRILREVMRSMAHSLKPGYDIVIVAKHQILKASFQDIHYQLGDLFSKANLINTPSLYCDYQP
ncbi:ribonuclease P protein component, partial [bacterium]|nr:ribonuclease P protein component [candidate division CSSED10-310 bacterium]